MVASVLLPTMSARIFYISTGGGRGFVVRNADGGLYMRQLWAAIVPLMGRRASMGTGSVGDR